MLTIHQLEEHFHNLPVHLLEILVELRNLVQQVAPGAAENVRRQGLVYYYPQRGGPVSAGICQILIQPDHIRLAFIHGALLPDPCGLLTGKDRLAKRYTCIRNFESAPWDDLRALIEAHSRFDPYTQTFVEPAAGSGPEA